MKRKRTRDPIARELRTTKFRKRVVEDKTRKKKKHKENQHDISD